jgi:hypothetical protein
MKTWYRCAVLASALLGFAANASTVTLTGPSSAAKDSSFLLTLGLSASDAPGDHPGLFVGSVTIDFDPGLLSYQGFTVTAPVVLQSGPTSGNAAGHTTVTLAFRNATDLSEIGKFSFKAIGNVGSNVTVGLNDADTFIGTFINKVPTDKPFRPNFNGKTVQITAVPVPAAAWLFGTALGAPAARARLTERAPKNAATTPLFTRGGDAVPARRARCRRAMRPRGRAPR